MTIYKPWPKAVIIIGTFALLIGLFLPWMIDNYNEANVFGLNDFIAPLDSILLVSTFAIMFINFIAAANKRAGTNISGGIITMVLSLVSLGSVSLVLLSALDVGTAKYLGPGPFVSLGALGVIFAFSIVTLCAKRKDDEEDN